MADISHSPTLRRRRLSTALRAIREERGVTAEAVSQRLEWSRGKLTHIERAQWRRPSPRDVRDLLDVYGVTDERRREALITLAREARQRGWWSAYRDVLAGPYADYENEAARIRTYGPLAVPDLLRTPDYAAALASAVGIAGSSETPETPETPGSPETAGAQGVASPAAAVDRWVEALALRQRLLRRPVPVMVSALVDEAALRKPVGGDEVRRAQLRHLAELNRLPNVEVRLVPDAAGAHPGLRGHFTVLEFPDPADPAIAHVEAVPREIYLEDPAEVRSCALAHDRLCRVALDPANSDAWFREHAGPSG